MQGSACGFFIGETVSRQQDKKREQLISELLSDYLEHWSFLTNLGLL